MKKKTIGIVLLIISFFFVIGSIGNLFTTREEMAINIKVGYEQKGIILSDVEVMKLTDSSLIYSKIGGAVFLILFLWVGYKGYRMYKSENIPV